MKPSYSNTVTQVTRLILIFLFAYTAVNKLLNLDVFRQSMMVAHIPEGLAEIISVIVPVSEIILVLLLTINQTKRLGLYGSLIIFLVFTGYIIYMKLWLSKLPCSCGGVIQKLTWNQHLFLNILLTVLIYYVIMVDKKNGEQNLYYNKQVTS
ncbi:MAG: MauE/DoxX family redox-associated membrane protein [Bacteroidota bacterium]